MKSPALIDSEDPVSNLLCELEPRLSETFETSTAGLLSSGRPRTPRVCRLLSRLLF
jgi:hypothetical protein